MKSLNQYIKESLLDNEENIVNKEISRDVIEKMLKAAHITTGFKLDKNNNISFEWQVYLQNDVQLDTMHKLYDWGVIMKNLTSPLYICVRNKEDFKLIPDHCYQLEINFAKYTDTELGELPEHFNGSIRSSLGGMKTLKWLPEEITENLLLTDYPATDKEHPTNIAERLKKVNTIKFDDIVAPSRITGFDKLDISNTIIISNFYNMQYQYDEDKSREKMKAWHNGERKENIKACSIPKLYAYLNICLKYNFTDEIKILKDTILTKIENLHNENK